ncbi:MAG: DNA replication protein [Proteobacteria bacterium]|nr:DNA replication protein [Pseudomonadota bacterium]
MNPPAQIPLDLPHRAAMGAADFLVAPCNRDAVSWLDRWPGWPAPALIIHGDEGCGKSHLTNVWQSQGGAIAIDRKVLTTDNLPLLLGGAMTCFMEDADRGFEEEALLHLYNLMAERGGHLLLTARAPMVRWGIALPDLSSRLATAMSVAVGVPDDELIAGVLIKHFLDRQIRVDPAVVTYLLGRMERSFAAARLVVAALDSAALAEKRGITVPLAREVLRRLDFDRERSED